MPTPGDVPGLLVAYQGGLDAFQAASAIQSARHNALDLLDTAETLFQLKRFAHAAAFSILAIEEAGKLPIIFRLFLGTGTANELWRDYRSHRAKTATLNVGIEARIRATFPQLPPEQARDFAKVGPTPDDLELTKQRAIYSDCLQGRDGYACHLPRMADWRNQAWERLCEARAIVDGCRDYPPDELEVWLKHGRAAKAQGQTLESVLPSLHAELLERGFVRKGQWDTLLADLAGSSGA
jgi:AbiV family abortive infection protein